MNRLTVLIMALALHISGNLYAQQTLTAKDMIAISPLVCDKLPLPSDAKSSLQTKMIQMVTANGFGASSTRYALVPNATVIDKQVTPTTPAQYIVELEVSLYVYDAVEDFVVDQTSFVVKGVDRLENKAIIQAINQIRGTSPQSKSFMNSCRSKIIDYYNTRIPALISKAESLSERQQYDQAIAILASVPETVDQYQVVAELMTGVYKKKIDHDATIAIQAAKGKMAMGDFEGVLAELSSVDPASTKSKEASGMIATIKAKIDQAQQAELDAKITANQERLADKEYNRQIAAQSNVQDFELRKQEVKAAKEIAVAYGKTAAQGDGFTKKVNNWFMNKFK